jgi:hypothetical protein
MNCIKLHHFLERLLVILQWYFKMLGPTIKMTEGFYYSFVNLQYPVRWVEVMKDLNWKDVNSLLGKWGMEINYKVHKKSVSA